jgi:hypothetical protein
VFQDWKDEEGMPRSRAVLIDSFSFIGIGLLCVGESYRLYVTRPPHVLAQELRPGLYVLLVGLVLLVAGASHLALSLKDAEEEREPVDAETKRRIAAIIAGLAGYAVLIMLVGYPAASFLFFLATLKVLNVDSWIKNISFSAVLTLVCYALFVQYFNIIFPTGLLIKYAMNL